MVPAEIPPPEASISASRIADCTGIPRETVRRKLVLLQQHGWVDRNPDGRWRLHMSGSAKFTQAHLDFAAVGASAQARVAELVVRLEQLADSRRV